MGVVAGADADALELLGRHMQQAADRLVAIRSEISAVLDRAQWRGADAEHFRGQWHQRLSGLLQTTAVASQDASKVLRRNADQQRIASSADGGAPGIGTLISAPAGLVAVAGVAGVVDTAGRLGWSLATESSIFGVAGNAHLVAESITELVKEGHQIPRVLESGLSWSGDALGAAGIFVDSALLGYQLAAHPGDAKTYQSAVDVAFDAAALVVAASCPPLGLGLAMGVEGLHVAYDLFEDMYPGATKRLCDGAVSVASDIGHAAVEDIESDVRAVKDVAGAVEHVATGGVHLLRSLVHW